METAQDVYASKDEEEEEEEGGKKKVAPDMESSLLRYAGRTPTTEPDKQI